MALREARRERQRAQNIFRAAQMHEARVAHETHHKKPEAAGHFSDLHIGCSGWFYWHWRGRFYPTGSKTSAWFAHYAKRFNTVELNAPFYAWPTVSTVKTWRKQAGRRRFLYTVKASELITHVRRFSRTSGLVKDFGLIADLLGPAMGCFLFNCRRALSTPPHASRALSSNSTQDTATWWSFVTGAGGTPRCMPHSGSEASSFARAAGPRLPDELVTTGEDVYIRFHGTKRWYRHDYTRDELKVWAERVRDAKPARVWAYFNNDREGYAIKNARTFLRLLRKHA